MGTPWVGVAGESFDKVEKRQRSSFVYFVHNHVTLCGYLSAGDRGKCRDHVALFKGVFISTVRPFRTITLSSLRGMSKREMAS
jgi:hypothetical protein